MSKYCYPGTNTLINHFDIKDPHRLHRVEKQFSFRRSLELMYKPIPGELNFEYLKKIHHYLFQDVYPFAGKIRTENIGKGGYKFLDCAYIERGASYVFQNLKHDRFFVGQPVDKFSDKASRFISEINHIHPFREGNGRTQREFLRRLCLNAGYVLDFTKTPSNEVLNAFISAAESDFKPLSNIIRQSIRPVPAPTRQLDRDPDLER